MILSFKKDGTSRSISVLVVSLFIAILAYSHFINVANYSFLSYTYGGADTSTPISALLRYSRLPVLLLGLVVSLLVFTGSRNIRLYFLQNWDILLLCITFFLGIPNALDPINASLYALWNSAAFLCVLTFFHEIRKSGVLIRWSSVFRLVFWSNFIVLPLLMLNLPTAGQSFEYHMAWSSKFFYPYCLLSMLMSIYGMHLFCNRGIYFFRSQRLNSWLELLTIILIFLFIFLGARRAALFVAIAISGPYLFFAVGRRYWKKVILFIIFALALGVSVPLALNYISENEQTFKVLKKLSDIRESGGDLSKESSYSEREKIWGQYWKIVDDHPFTGVGAYNGTIVHTRYYPGNDTQGYSTHNLFMGALVEHGFIGLTALILFLIRSLWIGFFKISSRDYLIYLFFLFVPILAINWNEYNLIPGQVFYWSTFLVFLVPRMFLKKYQVVP